jgi:hypothetical protein
VGLDCEKIEPVTDYLTFIRGLGVGKDEAARMMKVNSGA